MSMHKFHGQWRYFIIAEHHGSRWFTGQMLIYCLGGKHWRLALLQDTDISFCREFILSSPSSQIREARIRHDVLLTLQDGSTVHIEGISQTKLNEISKLVCQIRQQKVQASESSVVTNDDINEADAKYLYCDEHLGTTCLEGFHNLSQQGMLCDVTLVAQGEEFHCHRSLLAANSTYFHAMLCGNFVERNTDRIVLSEICGPTMKSILQYLYTGQLELDVDSVQLLFNASHMLQLQNLEAACVSYMMRHLTDNNCVGVHFFAKNFRKTDLKQAASERISAKFVKVTKASEFLQLPGEHAAEILELSTVLHTTEEEVYAAALRWLEFDMPARQEHMYRVMKAVRFIHIDECYFRERVKNKGIFKGCRPLQMLFEQIIYYMNHPYRWHELDLVMEPRRTKRNACPRAILYTSKDTDYGRTILEMYTEHRDTLSYLTEWRNWPTDDLSFPVIVTIEAPSKGIYLAGGVRSGKLFIKLDLGSRAAGSFSNCSWFKLQSMHHSRELFNLVSVDRFLYAVGGCHKGNNLDSVEKYILSKNQWVKVATLPCRLRGSCAVSYRGRMYVFGGESQTKKNRKRNLSPNVFSYDPETDRWATLRPMKTARALAGCALYRGKIYVIGGMSSLSPAWLKSEKPENELCTCEIFDPITNSWHVGPQLPRALASPGVVKYMGRIYVMGGLHNSIPNRSVYYLDESGENWLTAQTDLYHQVKNSTTIHSSYLPISLGASGLTNSDSDSETTCGTCGTSMEHFDMDSSSHSSDIAGYPNASWDTESSSSGF